MSNEQLKSTLQDLHRHLESAGADVDAELKDLLQVLDSDINQLLQQETPASPDEDSLAGRAQQLAARLAAQHPALERVLRQLTVTLESMGI